MSIPISEYVSVTSAVGGFSPVAERELMGRIFSPNPLIPSQYPIVFSTATSVGSYFGTTSEEYLRAVFYFAYISKSVTIPQFLSYAAWVEAAIAPKIYGTTPVALATLKLITAGAFDMTIDGVVAHITALDLSGAAALADIAALLQTAIRAAGTGSVFTSATVTYDSTAGAFNFVGGATGAATISASTVTADTTTLGRLGWLSNTTSTTVDPYYPIYTAGAAAQTITEALDASVNQSNNFGSFMFTNSASLSLPEVEEAAAWNASSEQNYLFQYMVPVSVANASTWSTALLLYTGTGVTLSPITTEYPEMFPMAILGATDYDAQNSTTNYMFQIINGVTLTPSVTTLSDKNTYDGLRINYYGQTQQAGVGLSFYQNGILMGGSNSATDMNVYANEQWLKDAITVQLMSLLIALEKISANEQGRGQVISAIQAVLDRALFNGTISPGKLLNFTQQAYITTVTGDPTAWRQVQSSGYWLNVVMNAVTNTANYTLVYSKDDVIRKIEGRDILI